MRCSMPKGTSTSLDFVEVSICLSVRSALEFSLDLGSSNHNPISEVFDESRSGSHFYQTGVCIESNRTNHLRKRRSVHSSASGFVLREAGRRATRHNPYARRV